MKYAVIESGGKQFKAVEGETIDVDRLVVDPGAEVKLEHVLLMVDGETVTVGTPTVNGISVLAKVLAHVKGEKLTVFKYRPKKRIRVKTGHRQSYTRLAIEQIGDTKAEKVAKPVKVSEEKKVSRVAKTAKAEKPVKEKKPVVEKETKTEKVASVKKGSTSTKTVKKPVAKKTTQTDKKPVVKKTTKTGKK